MDDITQADATLRDTMAEASRIFCRALRAERQGVDVNITPAALKWREAHQPANWRKSQSSETTVQGLRRLQLLNERNEMAEIRRVPARDPCTFCGTRADIGCSHKRVA